ncbi:MAG: hypothetical protein JXB08_06280 [Bacilli bacterium]|nr:hypothetical protein [Bacilli bacterium]
MAFLLFVMLNKNNLVEVYNDYNYYQYLGLMRRLYQLFSVYALTIFVLVFFNKPKPGVIVMEGVLLVSVVLGLLFVMNSLVNPYLTSANAFPAFDIILPIYGFRHYQFQSLFAMYEVINNSTLMILTLVLDVWIVMISSKEDESEDITLMDLGRTHLQ